MLKQSLFALVLFTGMSLYAEGANTDIDEAAIHFGEVNTEVGEAAIYADQMTPDAGKHKTDEDCSPGPHGMRISVRNIEARGIGYNDGYSTLDAFFSTDWSWTPFLDVRAHVFNNGKFAFNGGIGAREIWGGRVYGVNLYYDYRNTHRQSYNQIGAGLETLGDFWDLRLNGYFPFGKKTSSPYHAKFDYFSGHAAYISYKREFAMTGANLEAGLHFDYYKHFPIYLAGGPYYLTGQGRTAWGGQIRASVDVYDYLRIEANTSYDNVFKWIGQGQLSVVIPFGPRREVKQRNGRSCSQDRALANRAVQRVDRFEIIAVDTKRYVDPAINPATGKPYFFLFVNNLSHSLGTYESPFNTLLAAQNASSPGDFIYVFAGDGTPNGMSDGIILKNGQQLLGSGVVQSLKTSLGTISIPAFTPNLPVITSTGNVITLGSNNVVSGFYIQNNVINAIFGDGITNFTASQNAFYGSTGGPLDTILLTNASGRLIFNNNLFALTNSLSFGMNGVHIQQSTAQCSATFINNTFYCFPNNGQNINAIFADLSGTGSMQDLIVLNNTFFNDATLGDAIQASLADSSFLNNLTVYNCTGTNWTSGIEVDLLGSGSVANISVTNSTFGSSAGGNSLFFNSTATGSFGDITVTNCDLSNNNGGNSLYANLVGSGSITNLNVSNTNLNYNGPGNSLYANLVGSGSITNLSVSDCSLSHNYMGTGLNANLVSSGSITNLTVSNSNLDNNYMGTGLNANLGASGSITNLIVSNSSLSSNVSGTSLNVSMAATGSITNLMISNSTLLNSDQAYDVLLLLTSSGSITNFIVSNSTLGNSVNGGSIEIDLNSSGSIANCAISNSTLNNTANSIYINLSDSGSIGNLSVSNCDLSNNAGFGIDVSLLAGTGSIGNLAVSNSTLNDDDYGINVGLVGGSGSIGNITVSNCTLNNSSNLQGAIFATADSGSIGNMTVSNCTSINNTGSGLLTIGTNSIGTLAVTGCNFVGSTNGILVNNHSVSQLNISGNAFTGNEIGLQIIPAAAISKGTISNNTFNANEDNNLVINTFGSNILSVKGNTFTGIISPTLGYAATITAGAGSLCLDFAQNTAYPVNLGGGINPYSLINTATFDLTPDSTQANNIGTITESGPSFGSCTQ